MIQYLNLFVFTRNMEIIIKDGQEIKRYVPPEEQQSSGKKVKKVGIAYDLENGEIMYVSNKNIIMSYLYGAVA
ncbi:hypothetical protein EZS27_014955 [termite gut metagenome]|uniref:Uncharacterized protein n=1 Tax=termite gut metagenome TaxID=433724 RepID=A0A5J4RTK0_9ZZZZ